MVTITHVSSPALRRPISFFLPRLWLVALRRSTPNAGTGVVTEVTSSRHNGSRENVEKEEERGEEEDEREAPVDGHLQRRHDGCRRSCRRRAARTVWRAQQLHMLLFLCSGLLSVSVCVCVCVCVCVWQQQCVCLTAAAAVRHTHTHTQSELSPGSLTRLLSLIRTRRSVRAASRRHLVAILFYIFTCLFNVRLETSDFINSWDVFCVKVIGGVLGQSA